MRGIVTVDDPVVFRRELTCLRFPLFVPVIVGYLILKLPFFDLRIKEKKRIKR